MSDSVADLLTYNHDVVEQQSDQTPGLTKSISGKKAVATACVVQNIPAGLAIGIGWRGTVAT
jgi:hypothetical protein